MRAHDWFIEHRTEFAAQVLDPEDEEAFREHLARCEECRAEVARIEAQLGWLPMGASPVTLRPGLNRRIVDHALGVPRAPLRPRWLAAAAVACLLSGAIGWTAGTHHAARVAIVDSVDAKELAALEDTFSIMRGAAKVMQASLTMDGKEGGVVIFADARTHRWNVVLHGLPPAPPNTRYTFWFITSEEGMVRGNDVPFDPARPAMFTTGMPKRGGEVMGAAITLEPMQSVEGPPQGKHLVHLML
jgi:hypothetical protein